MNRRGFLKLLGLSAATAIIAPKIELFLENAGPQVTAYSAVEYSNCASQIAILKELYADDLNFMRDLVYAKNPWLELAPDNSFGGGYVTIPLNLSENE